jgi:sigma-B regulation protein RsbU (phosphoserine phosphatase)
VRAATGKGSPSAMTNDMPTVLVAEDDRIIRLKLNHVLTKEMGVNVVMAEDGDQAWEIFQQGGINFIISDWVMPNCTGPELCQRVRQTTGDHGYTYFILLTSKTESGELVEGMESGADDYIRKPFDNAELIARVKSGLRVIKLEQDLANAFKQLEETYQKQNTAVRSAGLLQRRSLPREDKLAEVRRLTGIDIAYRYESCEDLGGDIIGMAQPAPHLVAVYLADVSGHGIAPSLLAVSLNTYLQTLLQTTTDPVAVGEAAHKFCGDEFPDGTYATLVYMLFDTRELKAQLLIAGHPPALHIRPGGGLEQVDSGAGPVGLLTVFPLDPETSQLSLSPGERLLVYTDGLTETRNPAGEFYASENLNAAASRYSSLSVDELLDHLREDVTAWRGADVPPDDDISLLAVGIGPLPSAA